MVYKILSKILVNWLKSFWDKFNSPCTNNIVPSWQILDATTTSHEVMQSLENKKNPSMPMKLYIFKSYEKVRRDFLFDISTRLSFGEKFIFWLQRLSILSNFLFSSMEPHGNYLSLQDSCDKGTPSPPIFPSLWYRCSKENSFPWWNKDE